MFRSVLLFCAAACLVTFSEASAQSKPDDKPEFSVLNLFGNQKPIVYANKTDGLPDRFKAKGEIVEMSVHGTYCGTVATGGTIKIKLREKVPNYTDDHVFAIVLCLAGEENTNLVGKSVEMDVRKLTKYPYKFGVWLSNSIDSGGTPFYLASVEGVGGLLRQLKEKSE